MVRAGGGDGGGGGGCADDGRWQLIMETASPLRSVGALFLLKRRGDLLPLLPTLGWGGAEKNGHPSFALTPPY